MTGHPDRKENECSLNTVLGLLCLYCEEQDPAATHPAAMHPACRVPHPSSFTQKIHRWDQIKILWVSKDKNLLFFSSSMGGDFSMAHHCKRIAYFCERSKQIEHHCMDAGLLNALDGAVASEGREVINIFHICTMYRYTVEPSMKGF
jgi:hypothetical protein